MELSEKQEQVAEEALCDVSKCGPKEKDWWERSMGLRRTSTGNGEPGPARKNCRPHSKSDPSPTRTPVNNDPNASWHYDRAEYVHTGRFNLLQKGQRNKKIPSASKGRPRLAERSSSWRTMRDMKSMLTLTPKTKNKNVRSADLSRVESYDDQYYTLEPGGSPYEQGKTTPLNGKAGTDEGYFNSSKIPTGQVGTVTEHNPVCVRRTSKTEYFDISPPDGPSVVTKPPGLKTSISFVL